MAVGGVDGEVSSERVSIATIVVSWVHKCPLGADSDAILVSLGSLGIHQGGAIASLRRDGGPGLGCCRRGVGLDLCPQRLHLIV